MAASCWQRWLVLPCCWSLGCDQCLHRHTQSRCLWHAALLEMNHYRPFTLLFPVSPKRGLEIASLFWVGFICLKGPIGAKNEGIDSQKDAAWMHKEHQEARVPSAEGLPLPEGSCGLAVQVWGLGRKDSMALLHHMSGALKMAFGTQIPMRNSDTILKAIDSHHCEVRVWDGSWLKSWIFFSAYITPILLPCLPTEMVCLTGNSLWECQWFYITVGSLSLSIYSNSLCFGREKKYCLASFSTL